MPPPQIGDAMHVHIDTDALDAAPCGAHAQIRHLRSDPGKLEEAFDRGGDVGCEAVAQHDGRCEDVFGFDVMEAYGVNEGVEVRGSDGEDGLEGEAWVGKGCL